MTEGREKRKRERGQGWVRDVSEEEALPRPRCSKKASFSLMLGTSSTGARMYFLSGIVGGAGQHRTDTRTITLYLLPSGLVSLHTRGNTVLY